MNHLYEKIKQLKKKRNAIILVHSYQAPEVQAIADVLGDSLDLSQKAAATDAEVIVFCGVHFMAETAAIIAPRKTVLLPDTGAGCPMADMITAPQLRMFKEKYPGTPVVCYINSTAAVKAESDVCCTSSNAIAIVNAVEGERVLFVPDQNLGSFVAEKTNKAVICWPGHCPVHAGILPEYILDMKQRHPHARVVVHPECTPAVRALADAVLSTSGMCSYVRTAPVQEFIIGTETGIICRMQAETPGKQYYPATPQAVCHNMKKTSLEKIVWVLEDMSNRVVVNDKLAIKARGSIERMLAISAAHTAGGRP